MRPSLKQKLRNPKTRAASLGHKNQSLPITGVRELTDLNGHSFSASIIGTVIAPPGIPVCHRRAATGGTTAKKGADPKIGPAKP